MSDLTPFSLESVKEILKGLPEVEQDIRRRLLRQAPVLYDVALLSAVLNAIVSIPAMVREIERLKEATSYREGYRRGAADSAEEVDRLRALKVELVELVEALEDFIRLAAVSAKASRKNPDTTFVDTRDWEAALSRAHAALAKAKGETSPETEGQLTELKPADAAKEQQQ